MAALVSLEEKELLTQLKQGDQAAFEIIYDRYSERIFQNTLRLTRSREISEELLQEAFYRIWDKRAQIDPDKPFKAYLFRIAENLAYDHFRKVAKDRRLSEKLLQTAADCYEHIDDLIEAKEYNELLTAAINGLPERRREVFILCKLDGKSYHEVSKMLGISEATINDHIVKATRFLKEYFNRSSQAAFTLLLVYLLGQ
ncbi:RNA polymerase sigma factor [Mucilaginibacter sp. RS28]|uniref:RNA polymerase sigma factor n=1 Tax=Mucilaginibacter straminoryzae TaxID=2932774 RepID=A0A9X1X145_9SPHI|nr:sigma-70 family RNA polymerase sigma factor [Mucilaginibacter straminoryzae]MCJ8208090.1 RNA polymerase sigma factor [Mucilaginibacter straminoryzae]